MSGFGLSSITTNCVFVVLTFGFRARRKHKNTKNQCITAYPSRKSGSAASAIEEKQKGLA